MKKRDKRQEMPSSWIDNVCELLKGSVIAGLTVLVLLIICAVLTSFGVIRQNWMSGSVLAVCIFSAMVGGSYAANRIRAYTLMVGLGVACILFLLLLAAGTIAYGTVTIEKNGIAILASCLCGGGISGILTCRPRKKRKR